MGKLRCMKEMYRWATSLRLRSARKAARASLELVFSIRVMPPKLAAYDVLEPSQLLGPEFRSRVPLLFKGSP